MSKGKWEDISKIMTPEGAKKLKVGQLMVFNYEGSRNEYIVKRKTKDGKIWVKQTQTYTPKEFFKRLNAKRKKSAKRKSSKRKK